MLRISLSGPPNRRKQPERYMQCRLKLVENTLTKDILRIIIGNMKSLCFVLLFIFGGIIQMDGQNNVLLNLFDGPVLDYGHDKTFFDKNRCEINNNYDNIFVTHWESLERMYVIVVSSSGQLGFPPIYLDFEQNKTFKVTNRSHNIIGKYKFDAINELLYLKIDDNDYVFSIEYYKYNGKGLKYNNYKNILELYLHINATWDTLPNEIVKMEKIFYQRFVEE
jgi:hypothetical protein